MSKDMNDEYFKNNFNTPIPKEKEVAYQQFVGDLGKNGMNTEYIDNDYDMRGYFMKYGNTDHKEGQHFTDEFKKPNHMTFSDQSNYHGTKDGDIEFKGGTWGHDEEGNVASYTPSKHQAGSLERAGQLKEYFDKVEPDIKLIIPKTFDEDRSAYLKKIGIR